MKTNKNNKHIKTIIISLIIILVATVSNIIINTAVPTKDKTITQSYNIQSGNDNELIQKIQNSPAKILKANMLFWGFSAFFLLGIVNFILISRNFFHNNLKFKHKRTFIFNKTLEFSNFMLCISSVYLWYTIGKESQLIYLLFKNDVNFTYVLLLTFVVQLLSILSIIYLAKIKFFRFNKKIINQIPYLSYVYLALIPISIALASLSGIIAKFIDIPIEPMPLISIMASGKLSLAAYFLLGIEAVVFAPIAEELIFRGLIFGTLRKKFSFGFCALVSGIVFSVMHEHYLSFLPILLLALAFSYLYERTKNLIYPIILHSMYNGVSLIAVTLLKDIIN